MAACKRASEQEAITNSGSSGTAEQHVSDVGKTRGP